MPKTTPAQHFAKLFAMFTRGATPEERAAGERKMDQWLKRHGKTRADIPSILAAAVKDDAAAAPPPPPSDPRDTAPAPSVGANITPPDLVRAMLEDYVVFSEPHDYVAVALWAIHTHVFDQFMVTPRLFLTSPVRHCGKSRVLKVLDRLVARPELTSSITAANIYDTIDRERCTLLVDEADNLEVSAKAVLRAVLNAGHEKGGVVRRGVGKQRRKYDTFAPIALGAIGILTLPLMSRSIVIHMTRRDPSRRFDSNDTQDLDIVYSHIRAWAHEVKLNSNPDMPAELRGRTADNWRPLISIADACSKSWGKEARDAAVAFARRYHDEDIVVTLLGDIRKVFNAFGVDRIASTTLVNALNAMEDAGWSEWRGLNDDRQPRKLTPAELAKLLRPFRVRPRTLRRSKTETFTGYERSWFEPLWAAYCPAEHTSTQSNKITQLFAGQRRG
jgi:Protein of unknown function (DUF3631)